MEIINILKNLKLYINFFVSDQLYSSEFQFSIEFNIIITLTKFKDKINIINSDNFAQPPHFKTFL